MRRRESNRNEEEGKTIEMRRRENNRNEEEKDGKQ